MFKRNMTYFAAVALAVIFVSTEGQALDLTTNLLHAQPGSWIRRYKPHGYTETQVVVSVKPEAVVMQYIRTSEGKVEENRRETISADRIRSEGADPNAPDARQERVEHRGKTYDVKVVEKNGRTYYISSAIPASGILRIDIHPGDNGTALWSDDYGTQPDELIRKADAGE